MLTALPVVSSTVSAETETSVPTPTTIPDSCPKAFQGFYLGANIGYGVGGAKSKIRGATVTQLGPILATQHFNVKNHPQVRGVDGGLSLGYLHRINNLSIGLDFTANWVGAKASGKRIVASTLQTPGHSNSVTTLNSYSSRLENSLQLAARVGWIIDKTLPFIKLGWDNSRWKISDRLTGTNSDFHTSKSKRINAFLWGAGVDFLMLKNFVMGLEYTGTGAGNNKIIKDPRASVTWGPQYNKFALTAKYIFN